MGLLPLAFIGGTVAWLVALLLAPFLPAPLAALTYVFGSFICHQRPERSFHLGAAQLPVCARCIGIYAGAACASLGWALVRSNYSSVWRKGLMSRSWLILAASPTIVTILAEWTGVWQTSNVVRAVAGAPIGAAVAGMVIGAIHYQQCVPPRPIAPLPPSIRT